MCLLVVLYSITVVPVFTDRYYSFVSRVWSCLSPSVCDRGRAALPSVVSFSL